MTDKLCALCGQVLPDGSLKYIVHIEIVSDFDGFIPCSEGDPSEEIGELLNEMEDVDSQELEDDVYQELSAYLCMHCKKKFARELINSGEEGFSCKKDFGHLYH